MKRGNLDIWAVPTGGSEDIVEKDSERNNPRLLGQTTEARIEGIRVFRVFCWVAGVSRKGPAYIECIEIRGKAWNKSRLSVFKSNWVQREDKKRKYSQNSGGCLLKAVVDGQRKECQ